MSSNDASFLETADRIGARLCRDAVWAGPRCNWLSWCASNRNGSRTPIYRGIDSNLYEGTAGIVLFLARLYGFTRDSICKSTLAGATNQLLERISQDGTTASNGFYSGRSGIAYVLIEIGQVLKHEQLVARGIDLLRALPQPQDANWMTDVIDGSAGVIPALLEIAVRHDASDLLESAVLHGRYLLEKAIKSDEGWCWKTIREPTLKPLTGISHGVAGVASAMAHLYYVTGEQDFREAALEGLRYERGQFCPEHGNWPDYRQPSEPPADSGPQFMVAWCHGAAGIGMSRLAIHQSLGPDTVLLDEIETAIRTTAGWLKVASAPSSSASQSDDDYCLCHGVTGNTELMILAADVLNRTDLREIAESIGRDGIERMERGSMPWPCGIGRGLENLTLMLGTAGIGHFYLRLHDSENVPSPLIIMPNRRPGQVAAGDVFP